MHGYDVPVVVKIVLFAASAAIAPIVGIKKLFQKIKEKKKGDKQ
ncbi:MAG: hypothetical protein WC549_02130 [Actinomycetota bacterium]